MAAPQDLPPIDPGLLPPVDEVPRPWLAGYPRGVPVDYAFPDVPLTRLLDDAARDFPELPALRVRGSTVDFATLLDQVDRCAAGLLALGVQPGSRVAAVLLQPAAAAVVTFATWRIGAVLVPIDPAQPGAHLKEQVRAADCVALVTAHASVVGVAVGVVPHVVLVRGREWLPWRQRLGAWRPRRRRRRDAPIDFADLLAEQPLSLAPDHGGDVPAVVLPGDGAGDVVLSAANLLAASFQVRLWIPDFQAGQELVVSGHRPTSIHGLVRGLLFPVLSGATTIAADDDHELVEALREQSATIVVAEGRTVAALAVQARRDADRLRSVRAVLVTPDGAQPADAAAVEGLTGARVRVATGPTAGCGFTHAAAVYGSAVEWAAVVPVPATTALVVDDEAGAVEAGATGRLAVAGPQVAAGGWLVSDLVVTAGTDGAVRAVATTD